MLINFPDTAKAIANKAWEDGKKEILNIWESSKNDILNSVSSISTGLIKEAKTGIKCEEQPAGASHRCGVGSQNQDGRDANRCGEVSGARLSSPASSRPENMLSCRVES